MQRKVFIRNNLQKKIIIDDMGQMISPNELFKLSECYSFLDITESNDLQKLIKDNAVTLNNGKKDLKIDEAIAYLTIVSAYENKNIINFMLISVTIFVCLVSFKFFLDNIKNTSRGQSSLASKIEEVEIAINNLRNLEFFLNKTKEDMIATNAVKVRIEEEHEIAKELETITNKQFEAVSLAVNKQSTKDVVINYILGLVSGIAASLSANIICVLFKAKKDQKKQ